MAFQRSKVEEFESQGPTARLKPKRVTLGEFAGEFERLRTGPTGKRLSVGTLSDYVRALTKLRKSIGDDTPPGVYHGADVVRFFTHLRSAGGLAPATVNKVKRSLKAVFNVAKRPLAYVKVNPCDDIREDRLAETDNRYVTPDEFAKLRKACSGQRKPLWWEAFITLCYTAGVRKNEAVHLLWENVAFEEEEIRIVAKKGIEDVPDWQPKDFDARTIPNPSATVELLSALRIEAGFGSKMVFVSSLRLPWMRQQRGAGKWTEGQATLNNLNHGFGVLAKRAGVGDVCLHDLRRSCLTHWARKLPSHVTKELAGHSSMLDRENAAILRVST